MTRPALPLAISVAGHAAALVLLTVLASAVPPPLTAPPQKRFEIVLNAPTPPEAAPPVSPPPAVEPVPPTVVPEAPLAAPVVTAAEPPPPAPQPEAPVVAAREPPPPEPPRPIPKPKPKPKPIVRPREPPREAVQEPMPALPPTALAALPAPTAPSPEAAAGYRALLSAWLEAHKRYPDAARQRGEQGSAIVRFRLDRSGRVLDFGVTQSTGHADLDAGIADMLRGAQMPPFPPGLTLSQLDVSVTLRFSLTR